MTKNPELEGAVLAHVYHYVLEINPDLKRLAGEEEFGAELMRDNVSITLNEEHKVEVEFRKYIAPAQSDVSIKVSGYDFTKGNNGSSGRKLYDKDIRKIKKENSLISKTIIEKRFGVYIVDTSEEKVLV